MRWCCIKKKISSVTGACGELDQIVEYGYIFTCPCPSRVRCQRTTKGSFVITLLNFQHTCLRHKSRRRDPTHTSQWLGGTIENRITRNIHISVRKFVSELKIDYKLNTRYQLMWRAKNMMKDLYLEVHEKSFRMILALLSKIHLEDSGIVVKWSTNSISTIFQCAFIWFLAIRSAMK